MSGQPKILLVNPPIYDFSAYDFWLKPYGLLSVAGKIRGRAQFEMFDYLDRLHPAVATEPDLQSDEFGRGKFCSVPIDKPAIFAKIPRRYRRFGLPREIFRKFLAEKGPFDFALIQTVMTYWYPGVKEAIDDIKAAWPEAKIVLGGVYATLCAEHAATVGADLVIKGQDLSPLWQFLKLAADDERPAMWEIYPKLEVGAIKLTDGCPFKCTYCSVPNVYKRFGHRPLARCIAEFDLLCSLGAEQIAFYDDALLYRQEENLIPFLEYAIKENRQVNFHTPNALNARFITQELADLMVRAGFKTFYLGYESVSADWQQNTGSKIFADEFSIAVGNLKAAGAESRNIIAYQIVGHPQGKLQQVEESMLFAHSLGIRLMLAEFSPIPGTSDGAACSKWVDMNEPLMQNKTAFPIIAMNADKVNRLKELCRELNKKL